MLKSKDYPEVLIAETLAFQGFPLKLRDILFFGIRLTGKTSAQEFKVGDVAWIGFSDIFTEPLSFGIEQGFIALVGFFVDFAVSYTGKSSGTGESFPEPANAGEQVNISYGFLSHTPYLE